MQLEQSQREGNVLVPRFVLLQLRIYCPPTSLGCHGTAGSSRGLCPASTQGVSHFRLQRCWNNAAAHQRAERSPRDVGGEDDPWPHGSCGRLWGAGVPGLPAGPVAPLASLVHPWLPAVGSPAAALRSRRCAEVYSFLVQ